MRAEELMTPNFPRALNIMFQAEGEKVSTVKVQSLGLAMCHSLSHLVSVELGDLPGPRPPHLEEVRPDGALVERHVVRSPRNSAVLRRRRC